LQVGNVCAICPALASSETGCKESNLPEPCWRPVYSWQGSVLAGADKMQLPTASDGQPVRQSSRVMTPLIVFSLLCVVPAKATNCTGRLRPVNSHGKRLTCFLPDSQGKTWGPCSRPLTVHPTDSGPAGRKTSKSFARRGSWAAEPNYGTLKCWPAFTPTCYRQHGLAGACCITIRSMRVWFCVKARASITYASMRREPVRLRLRRQAHSASMKTDSIFRCFE